jgi:ribosomal protein RSM22 (predicted rRNA methylase)
LFVRTWPDALDRAIEAQLDGVPGRELARAALALSESYRSAPAASGRVSGPAGGPAGAPRGATAVWSPAERLAYLVVRAPATYAAVCAALQELQARGSGEPIASLLDLGAGPGVGLWAAADLFDSLRAATLIERDPDTIALGERLARDAGLTAGAALTWRRADLRDLAAGRLDLAPHDLVLLSYSIGELDDVTMAAAVDAAWRAARAALVIVEPGTPRHAARLIAMRQRLIDEGATIAAPCPHARACPLAPPDWCHFGVRLARSSLHRRIKQGALPYEDEKFSYIVAVRGAGHPASARVLRRPDLRKGFVQLSLCATDGLRQTTVTRSAREEYRAARDVSWGDAWNAAKMIHPFQPEEKAASSSPEIDD